MIKPNLLTIIIMFQVAIWLLSIQTLDNEFRMGQQRSVTLSSDVLEMIDNTDIMI